VTGVEKDYDLAGQAGEVRVMSEKAMPVRFRRSVSTSTGKK
jgi:hypothetical protein